MKAILEFNLPEENGDFKSHINGWKYECALKEIFNHLRKKIKYGDLPTHEHDLLENLIDDFNLIKDVNEIYD